MGDYRTEVDRHIVKFKNYDIFITALNKRFATIGTVWLKNSNVIYKVDKNGANPTDNKRVRNKVISVI